MEGFFNRALNQNPVERPRNETLKRERGLLGSGGLVNRNDETSKKFKKMESCTHSSAAFEPDFCSELRVDRAS